MTRSTHHVEESHVRNNFGMKLNERSLFLATAVTTGIVFLLCSLVVTLAPRPSWAFFSYILHTNLTGIAQTLTWGSFITGLLVWSLGTGLYAAVVARLHNRL
jgi:hypothetical protein